MAFYQDLPMHEGEVAMMKAMHAPVVDNPSFPAVSPQLANHLQIAPLIAIGTLDKQGRPWTTLWGGQKGLAQSLGGNVIGIKTAVAGRHDPVVEELMGKEATGTIVREEGQGRMVSGVTMDLQTRKRVKLFGHMIAGALMVREDEATEAHEHVVEIQLVLKIDQSLGNCPKYFNKKVITPAGTKPVLVSDAPQLSQEGIDLIAKADLFFVSSAQNYKDMDTNHRGGPRGFVRVSSNEASGAVLVWPEFSGNRLYQTLGNLKVNPVAGICVPDFDTGSMLYLTGSTEILVGADAAKVLPRSNLAIQFRVAAARFVSEALTFRGKRGEASPYNPPVRYLSSEKQSTVPQAFQLSQATLLEQTKLTPTISRFKFALSNAARHKAGQYVTFDFSSRLDIGYSHMRDDDPLSINDDYVRTFTVSSPPGDPPRPSQRLKDDEFEVTVRKIGRVTEELFKHVGTENGDRVPFEVGIKGFGGDFEISTAAGRAAFIAAGIGITPLLSSLDSIEDLSVIWTIRKEDLGLVQDVLNKGAEIASRLRLFVTNVSSEATTSEETLFSDFEKAGVQIERRRLQRSDVELTDVETIYLCTAVPMRKQLMEWLPERKLVFEDFNF
ncbi:hypothetical protein B0A48_15686 [Cryoendolithus antarcticus]|uniref:FAD-binding FR-type domain-containing protein n=1 Tax=Cryoendolithus antarcticus TaxID=1507870 RepID=A0A1V8SHA8_9PEZI|nr:hypothetical protein B0A48_15686 [Cryoendolithus antarcticus]